MSIQYIQPFVEAALRVFEDFFGEAPLPGKPYLFHRDEHHRWDLSALIGIGGESRGVVAVMMTGELAVNLTNILTGGQSTEVTDDAADAIGEVVNIIAGNAKKGLEEYVLTISLPSIICGSVHNISWPSNIPIIAVPCETSHGEFVLAVGLEDIIHARDASQS
ncbi:chemotaxis protein CheX [Spirochaeta africana]|uniref:Putative inhibitor of MCP methylation, CheC n=1 Tax=Spirochaeta africana (strain ATCC 700263 / DSM 8902 / Z-7692) TaxID=889378 RepID=H9UK70_SPIAZ|nr:chemotaxis protein CheX [Spirochaeta africana]AFG37913.1 putative inhibitor of MCP methylation, CheC [Spirochaeta africana DSM 8902]